MSIQICRPNWVNDSPVPDPVRIRLIWCRLASPDALQRARWSRNYNLKKIPPPPPLETRQFYFLYPFLSVFESRKVLCKKVVRKDENWFSADLQTPKRQKYWDSEPKAGKSSEMYWKVEKVRCIKFPACYKWRIILKLVQWTIITNLLLRCWLACVAVVKRVGAFLSPLFAPASQATVDMYTVCWRPYWNVKFRFIPMSQPIKWQWQVMVGFHYSSATSWHVCCLTTKRTQQMLQKLLGCGFSRLKVRDWRQLVKSWDVKGENWLNPYFDNSILR